MSKDDANEGQEPSQNQRGLSRRGSLLSGIAIVAALTLGTDALIGPAQAQQPAAAPASAQRKPNIVIIWGDDIGISDISPHSA